MSRIIESTYEEGEFESGARKMEFRWHWNPISYWKQPDNDGKLNLKERALFIGNAFYQAAVHVGIAGGAGYGILKGIEYLTSG